MPKESKVAIKVAVCAGGAKGGISGPMYHWRAKWEAETGAKLDLVEIPQDQFNAKVLADVRAGGGAFDGVMGPAYLYGDYLAKDYIVPIDSLMTQSGYPVWTTESVVPAVARLLRWGDIWYGCPNDANARILYYRNDVLTDPEIKKLYQEKTGKALKLPPRTWEDVAEIAELLAGGIDWNRNGKPDDFGFAMNLKNSTGSHWQFMSLSAPYVVNAGPKVTRYRNVYCFDPTTMEPIIDSPGHVRALEMLRRLAKTGNAAQTSWGPEQACDCFLTGQAIFCCSSGELARLAQAPERSEVRGKLACCALPGTLEVWSRKDERWKKLREPNRIGNSSGASWHGVICKASKHQELVYNLFAFHANRLVNTFNIGQVWSRIDPGRTFHFLPPQGQAKLENYTENGFDENDVREYTHAFYENYQAEGWLEYLRLPGAQRFYAAFDEEIAAAMADKEIPAEQALKNAAEKWRKIVAELDRELGPGRLKEMYQQSIGYEGEE